MIARRVSGSGAVTIVVLIMRFRLAMGVSAFKRAHVSVRIDMHMNTAQLHRYQADARQYAKRVVRTIHSVSIQETWPIPMG